VLEEEKGEDRPGGGSRGAFPRGEGEEAAMACEDQAFILTL